MPVSKEEHLYQLRLAASRKIAGKCDFFIHSVAVSLISTSQNRARKQAASI
jgi:hypothetical protein